MIIDEVYKELHKEKLCNNAYDFSVRFLGKSRSYYSVLKARKDKPSIEAVATLETALLNTSSLFKNNPHPIITRTHQALRDLSDDVGEYRVQRTQLLLNEAK